MKVKTKRRISMKDRVLISLQGGETLTSVKARDRWGIMDFPKVISMLRQDGHTIHAKTMKGSNRFGDPVQYKQYWLDTDECHV